MGILPNKFSFFELEELGYLNATEIAHDIFTNVSYEELEKKFDSINVDTERNAKHLKNQKNIEECLIYKRKIMKTELELLKEKIEKLEELQNNCSHDWNKPVEDVMEEKITMPAWRGGELYEKVIATREAKCWSRTCKICGKKEYTRDIEDVEKETLGKPKFR